MRNTYTFNDRFKLQLFAAEGGAGDDAPAADAGNDAPAAEEQTERTFTQAELDRIIDQRLARERKDAEKRLARAREEGKSEAEKLAKMTEAERVEHARRAAEEAASAREADLARREAEISRRELMAGAASTLAEKGLPSEFVKILEMMGTSDADSFSNSIKVMEEVFRKAVQEGVEARLNRNSAPLKRGNHSDALLDRMRKAAGLD